MKLSWSWWRLAFQGDSLQLDFLGIPSDSRLNLASRVLSQNRKTPTKKVALHSGAAQGSTVFLTLSLMCFKNWPLQGQHLEMFLGYFWYDRYSAYQVATPLESFGGSWCGISSLNEELLLEFSICLYGITPHLTSRLRGEPSDDVTEFVNRNALNVPVDGSLMKDFLQDHVDELNVFLRLFMSCHFNCFFSYIYCIYIYIFFLKKRYTHQFLLLKISFFGYIMKSLGVWARSLERMRIAICKRHWKRIVWIWKANSVRVSMSDVMFLILVFFSSDLWVALVFSAVGSKS